MASKMTNKNINKSERVNQLVNVETYKVKNMIFSDPTTSSVPDSVPPIVFRRINISTLNDDGTVGDLILPTSQLFSFGISENIDPKTKELNGYSMALCLWNKNGVTKEEKAFTDCFNNIIETSKNHLLEHKEEVEQYELTDSDLKKFNPLYWKKDKGKIVEGFGPTLYAKLIIAKKTGKIVTMFHDSNGDPLDAMAVKGKYCHTKAAIKIESIFMGAGKNLIQIKLYEAEISLLESQMKPLLARPKADVKLISSDNNSGTNMNDLKNDDDDTGSLNGDEEKEPVVKPLIEKPVEKVTVRKAAKIVKK